ncbi:MAG: DUF1353 domain-containing protein [Candidatus Heimdallarchaeaceae archaeon]
MSSFTDNLLLEQLGGDEWRTKRDLVFYSGDVIYTVPSGFKTDLASIPRIFWSLIGHPAGEYSAAAVLHDWLYSVQIESREKSDKLLLEGMEVLEVKKYKRYLIYWAVRIGGWKAWNKYSKKLRK